MPRQFVYLALLSLLAIGEPSGALPGARDPPIRPSVGGGDGGARPDGKILFPSDDADASRYAYDGQPSIRRPACKRNATFCEDATDYPKDVVEVALRRYKDLKLLAGVDLVADVSHRGVNLHPDDSSSSLCESVEKVVYPKVALSKDMQWLFVVNQGDFTQGVRVEICRNENDGCGLIDGFAEGYKTLCKQKYIYRQLVAVSPSGEIRPEMFRFPASCCCHIKFMDYPFRRIGRPRASAARRR